jgi:hypothetical protein
MHDATHSYTLPILISTTANVVAALVVAMLPAWNGTRTINAAKR